MDRRTFMKAVPAMAMLAEAVTARAVESSPASSTPGRSMVLSRILARFFFV